MDAVRAAAQLTYDRVSRAKDLGTPGPPPELAANRAAQDAVMAERHRGFDLSAQDHHSKSERLHFAVVGEGTRSAQDRYRAGYEQIDWRN